MRISDWSSDVCSSDLRQASAPPHWSSAMSRPNGATSLPEIIMGESEYDRLLELAAAAGRRAPETAAPLLQELERATVVEMRQIPPDVVRLGSDRKSTRLNSSH